MAVEKQGYNITFGQGLDTKTDPNQVVAGKFLMLKNVSFGEQKLQKRNGFGDKTQLPDATNSNLTTLNGNLIASGTSLYAYSEDTNKWVNQGPIQTVDVAAQALFRNSASQSGVDSAITSNGLVCFVYNESSLRYYQVSDSTTGQAILPRVQLPATSTNPRVFLLGQRFIITFIATVAGTPHLQYIAVPINSLTTPTSATDISTQVSSLNAGYDGYIANNNLYLAWNGNDGGGAVRAAYLTSTLGLSSTKIIAGFTSDLMSVTADISGSTAVIWLTFWNTAANTMYSTALTQTLLTLLAPTLIATADVEEVTSLSTGMSLTVLYQVNNSYTYTAVRTDFVNRVSISQAGLVGPTTTILRSVGLQSKAFYDSEMKGYVVVSYGGAFQPTYFLIDTTGAIIAKLAYSNGAGYNSTQVLASVSISDNVAKFSYLIKDLLVSVNKEQGVPNVAGVYTQTGINLATMQLRMVPQYEAEIANALHLTGGYIWEYDGVKPVEHSFHVWPEDLLVTTSAVGGNITAQQYYYIFCYEWTDAQGLLHRSAPSAPAGIVTVGATSINTINVPTLRLTSKTSTNNIRLVGYRWSTAQQLYYQFTSITSPVLNNKTVDSIAVTDTLPDSSILGNTLLYTTGGVIENIAAPASSASTLYKSRLWIVDAEDRNLLWYSKQVIQGTPVEMSDLFTLYVAPTASAQGATGPVTALSAMDDKLIIFKRNAIYYVTGTGPDNTGANNDFSEPVFITSTVGCANPNSIVFMPQGIMFQSDKGIWMLGRDLNTVFIGADVTSFDSQEVKSALTVPGTNEVRFTLNNGSVLMYDYFYAQWGEFTGIPGVSSTLYQNLHTYLNSVGVVRQETPGVFLDGSSPVLQSFTSAWFKLTNLQGFQRAYFFYLLGEYITPHKLNLQIAYDYNPAIMQTVLITPDNFSDVYGSESYYGGGTPYGGPSTVEQWRVFLNRQKCQSMQITVTEVYDASKEIPAGAGFTLSGINLVFGAKGTYPKLVPNRSAG